MEGLEQNDEEREHRRPETIQEILISIENINLKDPRILTEEETLSNYMLNTGTGPLSLNFQNNLKEIEEIQRNLQLNHTNLQEQTKILEDLKNGIRPDPGNVRNIII